MTISGGPGGTFACEVLVAYDPNANNTTFAVNVPSDSTAFLSAIKIAAGDNFTAGAFTASNTVQDADTVVSGSSIWAMSAHSSGMADQGTSTLNITSTGTPCNGSNGAITWLSPQGSLNVSLAPQTVTGATGTVTAVVTFTGSGLAETCGGSGGGSGGGSAGGSAGGSGGGSGGGSAESVAAVTLSGGVSGTMSASMGVILETSGSTLFGLYGNANINGETVALGGFLGFTGFDAGTYSTPSSGGSHTIAVTSSGVTQNWGSNATANYTLNITSTGVGTTLSDGNTEFNSSHGTLTETLTSLDGGTPITMSATF